MKKVLDLLDIEKLWIQKRNQQIQIVYYKKWKKEYLLRNQLFQFQFIKEKVKHLYLLFF